MLYAITHRTSYVYQSNVSVSHHLVHLRPRELPHQSVQTFALEVTPECDPVVPRLDFYGNEAALLTVETPHRKLVVTARSTVRVTAPTLPASTPAWETVRDLCASDQPLGDSNAGEYLFNSRYIPREKIYANYAGECFQPGSPLLVSLQSFIARIYREFTYAPRATTIGTPLAEVLKTRRGVCQDFAHFGIACLRSIGLPARYVSGYLETTPPPGRARLVGADASHAWLSVWCPGHGWLDADPTNNLLPGERHITLAWGRDFGDVSPVRGVVVGGGAHKLSVSVDVAPLVAAAR